MQPQLTFHQKLMRTVSWAAMVPALVAGAYTGHFLNDQLVLAGLGGTSAPLALAGAGALTIAYGAFTHTLVNGLAPLPPEDRANYRPAIAAGVVTLMAASAYPNIIVTGGGMAAGIEDRAYIAQLATVADGLKRTAQSAEQIQGVVVSGGGQLEAMALLESGGGVSGAGAQGTLVEAIRARSQALKAVAQELSGPRERIADEINRIDQSTDKMRAALADTSLTAERRRVIMQRHGDEARSAAIAVMAATPVAQLQAVADGLMGPQIEPPWSSKPDIRKKQEEGFRKFKDELRRLGKSLSRHTGDLGQALKVTIPVYDPPPPSLLVLKHFPALTSIYAFAIALDGLPVILYLLACALSDAQRRRATRDLMAEPTALTGETQELGTHPYPAATRARAALPQTRRNGHVDATERRGD